jgi:transposase-like protein
MRHYSSQIKETMVAKLCSPGGPSVYQLSKETGISQGSLYNWVQTFGGGRQVAKSRRPEDWSPEERLQAVFEAQGLDEQALGEFLRKKGLHSHHIEAWKKEAIADAAVKKKRGRPRKDPELAAAEEEIKKLKRDLRRKEKALAEQTALVILQKKAQELWGKDEDDE